MSEWQIRFNYEYPIVIEMNSWGLGNRVRKFSFGYSECHRFHYSSIRFPISICQSLKLRIREERLKVNCETKTKEGKNPRQRSKVTKPEVEKNSIRSKY